jgi:uncharacterized repeat protein (TIGR03803 family)
VKHPVVSIAYAIAAAAAIFASPEVAGAQSRFEVLHSFDGAITGASPSAALIQATDGNFYGMTPRGGLYAAGTIFQMTPSGAVTVLHSFILTQGEGGIPQGALIQASDGNFYGTASTGGACTSVPASCVPFCHLPCFSSGTVFRMAPPPSGAITVLHAFPGNGGGGNPLAALLQATDGNFYGTTFDAPQTGGTVFQMAPGGTVTILPAFSGEAGPSGALIQALDGNFYGSTDTGGAFGSGTLFRMTPGGSVTVLHTFADTPDGAHPTSLVQAADGNFYGTTWSGGALRNGTIFRMDPQRSLHRASRLLSRCRWVHSRLPDSGDRRQLLRHHAIWWRRLRLRHDLPNDVRRHRHRPARVHRRP